MYIKHTQKNERKKRNPLHSETFFTTIINLTETTTTTDIPREKLVIFTISYHLLDVTGFKAGRRVIYYYYYYFM